MTMLCELFVPCFCCVALQPATFWLVEQEHSYVQIRYSVFDLQKAIRTCDARIQLNIYFGKGGNFGRGGYYIHCDLTLEYLHCHS